LTIDALWAMHAAGAGSTSADRIVRALAGGVDDYIGTHGYGDRRARVAGATAKVLLAAAVTGRNTARFGGYDLRAEVLELMQGPGRPQPGRFSDLRTGFDSSNTISQATAVLGLALTGGAPARAVRFLRQQQCPGGGFRMYADQGRTCAQAPAGTGAPDVDGTAMAVQALLAARAQGVRRLDDAISRAVGWLAAQQERDGSFAGGQITAGANANSTGLAGQALLAGGRAAAAAEATRWLRSLQLRRQSVRGTPAGGDAGAVAYDRSTFDAARSDGIDAGLRDQWRRATAQAVLGLARVSFLDLADSALAHDPRPPTGTAATPAVPDPADAPASGSDTGGPGGGDAPADREAATTRTANPATPVGVHGRAPRALATFLLGRLSGGDHVEVRRDGRTYVDNAATVDVALALAQLGADHRLVAGPADYLATRPVVRAYVHGAPYDRPGAFYADAAADLVLLGALRGDVDEALVAALVGSVDDAGWAVSTGRLAGPDHSVSTQAATVLALTAAGARAAARDARGALRAARCDDGSFPARSAGGPCAGGDVGATGWALQALAAVPAAGPHQQAAGAPAGGPGGEGEIDGRRAGEVRAAAEVLLDTRADDGLWHDGRGAADVLASSAADAGLRAVGRAGPAAAASLARLQADDGGFAGPAGAAGTSDLTASAAAAPTVARTSLLTMPGSVLGSGLTVPAATPADLSTTLPSAATTAPQSTGTDAGQVPGWLLLALGGLLAVGGATAIGWRLRRRPGLTA
jgi:hypothetical protein